LRKKIGLWFVLLSTVSASAQTPAAPVKAIPATASNVNAIRAPSANLSEEELAAVTGGAADRVQTLTDQNLSGAANGNSLNAESIESGAVNFGANALNFNGIGNFVINTGNNNVLQGSLSVTIVTAPLP
jgi:hypothetical protein